MRKLMGAAALLALSCGFIPPAMAGDGSTSQNPVPAQAATTAGSVDENLARYITAGDPLGNWNFLFGPRDGALKTVALTGRFRNGELGFSCNSTGKEEMALDIAGVHVPVGETAMIDITIGNSSHKVRATARRQMAGQVKTIFDAGEEDAAGVLKAISGLPAVTADTMISMSYLGRTVHVPNPDPHDMSVTAAALCMDWHNNARMKAAGITPPTIMPSSPLHTPGQSNGQAIGQD